MDRPRTISAGIASLFILLNVATAHAAFFSYTITGTVLIGDETWGSGSNEFGLSMGDVITATGIFDDAPLLGGTGTISFESGSLNTMTISVGSATFTASNDKRYSTESKPSLHFDAFALDDFDYLANVGVNLAPQDFSSDILGFDDLNLMIGEWSSTVQTAAVPEPISVVFVSTALAGLLAIRGRQKKA